MKYAYQNVAYYYDISLKFTFLHYFDGLKYSLKKSHPSESNLILRWVQKIGSDHEPSLLGCSEWNFSFSSFPRVCLSDLCLMRPATEKEISNLSIKPCLPRWLRYLSFSHWTNKAHIFREGHKTFKIHSPWIRSIWQTRIPAWFWITILVKNWSQGNQ